MRNYLGLGIGLLVISLIFLLGYRTEPSAPYDAVGVLAGVSLNIDFALNDTERQQGLSGRSSIPGNYGMLFVFPKDGSYGFWMKDTLVPLDIFWLDAQGKIVSIAPDVATSTYPNVFYPDVPARYVLETVAGFARAHNVATGTALLLNFPKPVSK